MSAIDVRLVTCASLPAPDPCTPLLADGLRAAGVSVDVADWRDPRVDWSNATVTVVRSPWDYVEHVESFVEWARSVDPQTRLWNPLRLLEWNVHKSYLLDVQSRGAPIVPTVVLLRGSDASLDGIADAQGWNTMIVKPAVGVGAKGAGRFDVGDPRGQAHLDALLTSVDVLVQPFLTSVTEEGEHSVVLIDGEPTHAVRKVPGGGDYRVHEEWGGASHVVPIVPAAAELAERVLGVLPAPTLYARIDLLRGHEGWQVLEIEVTEPSLWLDRAPDATNRLVDAVMARLG